MSNVAKRLDSISGNLFFAGMIIIKAKYIPHALASTILNLIALSVYLMGYLLWFIATICYPNHPKLRNKWYGFTTFKEQFQISSLIGFLATIFCLVFPVFILPAAWLFVISNLFWVIGVLQQIRTTDLPTKTMSPTQEVDYLRYVVLITTASVVAAIAATAALLFPPIAPIVLSVGAVIGLCVSLVGMIYLARSHRGNGRDPSNPSYAAITNGLNEDLDLSPTMDPTPSAALDSETTPLGLEDNEEILYPSGFFNQCSDVLPVETDVVVDTQPTYNPPFVGNT